MKKLVIVLLAAAAVFAGCTGTKKQLTDRDILNLIYQQAGGENWDENASTNWGTDAELSEWKNVKVNEEGRVTSLTLRNLKGVIPAEISGLTELKDLTLSIKNSEDDNDPADCIPASLSELTKLEDLSIYCSGVDATLPDLKPLTQLQSLTLSMSDSQPFPDLSGQKDLTSLDLSGFKGAIPESIFGMDKLERLYINTSALQGGLSPKIANLKALKHLQIDHTAGMIGSVKKPDAVLPEEIFSIENLEVIFLRAMANGGTVPAAVSKLQKVRTLNLIDLGLTGELPKELGELSKIQSLEIYNQKLSGGIPAEIGNATTLKTLWLHNNGLTGTIPAALGKLVNLESLKLDQNQLTGKIPAELANCTKLGKGVFTDFSKNQLDPDVPAAVQALEYFSKFKF